jgi:hypothetical protein
MGRVMRPETRCDGDPMHDDNPNDNPEVLRTNEARQGQVSKGAPIKWVLIISTGLAALALLVVYLAFAE